MNNNYAPDTMESIFVLPYFISGREVYLYNFFFETIFNRIACVYGFLYGSFPNPQQQETFFGWNEEIYLTTKRKWGEKKKLKMWTLHIFIFHHCTKFRIRYTLPLPFRTKNANQKCNKIIYWHVAMFSPYKLAHPRNGVV